MFTYVFFFFFFFLSNRNSHKLNYKTRVIEKVCGTWIHENIHVFKFHIFVVLLKQGKKIEKDKYTYVVVFFIRSRLHFGGPFSLLNKPVVISLSKESSTQSYTCSCYISGIHLVPQTVSMSSKLSIQTTPTWIRRIGRTFKILSSFLNSSGILLKMCMLYYPNVFFFFFW